MGDALYVLLTIGFFALAYSYISGCARVLGAERVADADHRREAR